MKILVTIERFDPGKGGAERSTQQVVEGLRDRGHEVTLAAGVVMEGAAIEGVRIESAGMQKLKRGSEVWRYRGFVAGLIKGGGYEGSLSVTTLASAAVVEPRAGVYRFLHRAALRWQAGGVGRLGRRLGLVMSPKQRAMRAAEAETLGDSGVKRFVALSRFMREQLVAGGVDEERVVVIPNAAQRPVMGEGDRERVRAVWGVGEGEVVFVFPAHAVRRKGGWPLVAAMKLVKDERAVLVMVCPEERGLRAWVERCGVGGRVRLVGESRAMGEVYAGADVVVLPSYYDPASKVVAEALLAGTPVITTRTNGACDLVEPGAIEGLADGRWRGRVVDDADDVAGLVRAMDELCDEGVRRGCAEAAAAVAGVCSMERHVERLEGEIVAAGR
ncbi:MAG: glycosyltransferase family 4 protein [Phycisphaeraceae bacterium]